MKKTKFIASFSITLITILFFSFQDPFFEIAKQIEIYNNVFKTLSINYIDEINPGELTAKSINSTLSQLDPYTRFYNEQQMEDVKIKRQGEYAGIGISTWYVPQGILITDVKQDYPADKAGLKIGDIITVVDGQSLKGIASADLKGFLRGTPNTKKKITLLRNNKPLDFELTLDKIRISPVPFFGMIDNEVGYIKLNRFTASKSTTDVRNAFVKLEEKGMKKLVFDLRGNPGGSLNDAVSITNLFIEQGKKVVDTRGKIKRYTRVYKTKNLPLNLEIPVVILINRRSASASEIVSGALQDYDRAVVLGQRSFGKGLVQRYFDLNYGTKMKATISKYYTPSGRCIQELDYANRDLKTGKVPKFSDGKVTKFKTEKGRPVFDGGGVTPDIEIKISKKTDETNRLLRSRAIFNFANEFQKNNPVPTLDNFEFTSSDFNAFTSFLKTKDTAFISKQEGLFKKAYKSIEKPSKFNSSYNALVSKLKDDKIAKISENKDLIVYSLTKELSRRYFYEKGMYQYLLKKDNTIKKAVALLNNQNEYNKILKK